jgi:excisionase family DNA binding protein
LGTVDDLLTTKQLEDLLQVDRVTIYRMLSDGRLRGFKVGGQWRFSRQEIEAWLQAQRPEAEDPNQVSAASEETISPSKEVLPLSCVQAIQGVCAEALDLATTTTDLNGNPLTDISNSCAFCNLILSTDEGRRRCAASWQMVSHGEVHPCHAGILCASVPIDVSGQTVALAAVCQFVPASAIGHGHVREADLVTLVADLGLDEEALRAATGSVRTFPEDHLPRVSRLLRRVADTFSEIGQERLVLLTRLQRIAEMSQV